MAQVARLYRSGHTQYNKQYRMNYGHKQHNNVITDTEQAYTRNGNHEVDDDVGIRGGLHRDAVQNNVLLSREYEHNQAQILDNNKGVHKRGYHILNAQDKKEASEEQREDIIIEADDMGRGGMTKGVEGMFSGANRTARGGHYRFGWSGQIGIAEDMKSKPVKVNDGDDQIAEENYGDKEIQTKDDKDDLIDKSRMGKLEDRPQANEEMQKSFWM